MIFTSETPMKARAALARGLIGPSSPVVRPSAGGSSSGSSAGGSSAGGSSAGGSLPAVSSAGGGDGGVSRHGASTGGRR